MTNNGSGVRDNQSRIQISTSSTQMSGISFIKLSPLHLSYSRCVYPDCGGGFDDGRRLPRLLRSHQGVAVHAGIGE